MSHPTQQKLTRYKTTCKIPMIYFFLFPMMRFIFPKSTKWRTFSMKHVKKKENVNFIFKFIPSSYIKTLLEIVVKLKIKNCWPWALLVLTQQSYSVMAWPLTNGEAPSRTGSVLLWLEILLGQRKTLSEYKTAMVHVHHFSNYIIRISVTISYE